MPEGPECRHFAEDLAKRVSYRELKSVEILSGRYLKKEPSGLESFNAQLPVKVVGVGVHGKFIYWILQNELSVWNTLGMTGNWSTEHTKHSRVKFNLSDGAVYFNDMRNFGTLKFVRGKFQLIEKLQSLGPDMLVNDLPDIEFIEIMRKKNNWSIVKAIMEQSVIAGVGNYIKADCLWLARISPHKIVSELSDQHLSALNSAIKRVLQESYNSGGATIRTYQKFDGSSGEYGQRFLVYDQKFDPDGQPVVKEMTADNRMTHWVPTVQL